MITTIIRHTMNPSTTTMKGRGEYNTEKEKIQMESNVKRIAYATNPTWYTALYRQKGSRRFLRCGYRSMNLGDIQDLVYGEIRDGKYAAAKIINADSGDVLEKVV